MPNKTTAPYKTGDQVLALFSVDNGGTSYGPLVVERVKEIDAGPQRGGFGRRWRITCPRPGCTKFPTVEFTVGEDGRDASGYLEPRPLDRTSSASRQHYIDTGRYLYADASR